MIQIAIVEDDRSFLQMITSLIDQQPDINCLLSKSSIGEFYQALNLEEPPDVLLLNQQIGSDYSLEHLEKIYKMLPDVRILIMTGYESSKAIRKSLLLGVRGYYCKGENFGQLLFAIREIANGNAYLSPKAASIALEMLLSKRDDNSSEPVTEKITARLSWQASQREMTVIRGLIDGKSYKEIAAASYMTIDGVRYYVRSIYPKLGVSTRDQLVRVLTR